VSDLSTNLGGATAPPIDPNMGPALVSDPRPMAPPVLATNVANKVALGQTPNLWDKAKDAAGSAQYSLTAKVRALGVGTAKLVGADETTGGNVGEVSGLVLFWALVAGVFVLVAYQASKLFGSRTIKL
jgi:hypothetical protein